MVLKIGIVGLGYVGLTLAIAATSCGSEVFGMEINPTDCGKSVKKYISGEIECHMN